ncbi:MAG: PQQ-binding-like beta-propeller repeat protein [Planctomycetota bacterium]
MPIKPGAVAGHLYVGIRGCVLALRKHDGTLTWSTKLRRGSSFVPIIQEGDRLYAASGGEVSCLDAATGAILWHNLLKGYGAGYASLAGAGFPTGAAALEQAARAAAAGAAAG